MNGISIKNNYSIFLCTLMAVCAVSVLTVTLYVLLVSHWHGPFRDMWEIYPFLKKIIDKTWTITDLWESYGYSHRLFIPRLLFIADYEFSDASNHLLISVSIFCQIVICMIFAFSILSNNALLATHKYTLIALVVCLQFSGTLLFNFMHTFDVQWFLCCLFVSVAFYILSIINTKGENLYVLFRFLFSGTFIILACLSNFSGLAAWPIWIILVFTKLDDKKLKLFLIGMALICIGAFSFGVQSAGMTADGYLELLKRVLYVFVKYPLLYLGNPLSNPDFVSVGYWVALLVIPVLFVIARFWWIYLGTKHTEVVRPEKVFLASIGLFAYGVAVMTAIGRGYDPNNVYAMRYQNIVMLFWSAALPLMFLESLRIARRLKYTIRFVLTMTFFGLLGCQLHSWQQNLWLGYQVNRAHLALMMGLSNNVPVIAPTVSRPMIYVAGYNLERERMLHQESHKGIYHGVLADYWLNGIPSASIAQECPKLSWSITPTDVNYSHYISFVVSGETKAFDGAALVKQDGKVMAMAIPEAGYGIINTLGYSLGYRTPTLRGFAVVEQEVPYMLVMFNTDSGIVCKSIPDNN